MKRALQIGLAAVACFGSVAVYTQSPQSSAGFPVDDTAYKSSFVPKLPAPGPDMRITDDARARQEWMRERMGGALSPQFMGAMLDAARVQRAVSRRTRIGWRGQLGERRPGAIQLD